MITLTSNGCRRYNHPEFIIRLADSSVLEMDAKPILQHLENEVSQGVKYLPTQTLQVGWMIVIFKSEEEYLLSLNEPDMKEIPIRFVNSMSNTVHHLRLQKDAAESIGAEPCFPNIRQSALKCSKYDDNSDFFMERSEPAQNDSGWFFGCSNPKHDHNELSSLRRVSLYDLGCSRADIIPFLAFPPGCSIMINGPTIAVNLKGVPCLFRSGSYLDLRTSRHE